MVPAPPERAGRANRESTAAVGGRRGHESKDCPVLSVYVRGGSDPVVSLSSMSILASPTPCPPRTHDPGARIWGVVFCVQTGGRSVSVLALMETRELTIGHSPDPDDAFMFYALTQGKIDTGGLIFREVVEDIETLNHRAVAGELDVTALSVHAYGYVVDQYALLPCGGSFGDRYGPVVVAPRPMQVGELADARIGVPGTMTSAYLLLKLLLMNFRFEVIRFDKILDAVANGEVEAGLLIHEGQITFPDHQLHKVVDLGEWWHADTGLPVPLGVNGVRKSLGVPLMREVGKLLSASIQYGLTHRAEAVQYAMRYARGLSSAHTDRFVGMYVNQWTVAMGDAGRQAVLRLLTRGYHAALLPQPVHLEVVE